LSIDLKGEEEKMRTQLMFKQKGITLIELLVALVLLAVVMGAVYRLFIVQTRAYTVQDEAVELQQNVRSVMGILLRDLRMTGYDDDSTASEAIPIRVPTPMVTPVQDGDITVSYEYTYTDTLGVNHYERHTVRYWRDAPTLELRRQLTIDGVDQPPVPETLLTDVSALTFFYGVDADEDGDMDDQNADGIIDDNDWVAAAGVGTSKVVAVRVTLTARPTTINPDVQARVTSRTLISAVTLRNLMMK
jgi:prepilin-type N-terminal cleavage/methylation domain-containing protein